MFCCSGQYLSAFLRSDLREGSQHVAEQVSIVFDCQRRFEIWQRGGAPEISEELNCEQTILMDRMIERKDEFLLVRQLRVLDRVVSATGTACGVTVNLNSAIRTKVSKHGVSDHLSGLSMPGGVCSCGVAHVAGCAVRDPLNAARLGMCSGALSLHPGCPFRPHRAPTGNSRFSLVRTNQQNARLRAAVTSQPSDCRWRLSGRQYWRRDDDIRVRVINERMQ